MENIKNKEEIVEYIVEDLILDVPARKIIDKAMFKFDLTNDEAFYFLKEALVIHLKCEKKIN